ncbi:MAG: hypothetical protein ABIG85_03140 [Chloroflexota bacterium]
MSRSGTIPYMVPGVIAFGARAQGTEATYREPGASCFREVALPPPDEATARGPDPFRVYRVACP